MLGTGYHALVFHRPMSIQAHKMKMDFKLERFSDIDFCLSSGHSGLSFRWYEHQLFSVDNTRRECRILSL